MSEIHIPNGLVFCVQDECPKAAQCMRHILYRNNTQAMPHITILNPLLTPFTQDGCPHFREYQIARYARGFRKIYNALPVQYAKKFWLRVPGITSESMYYRMKRGDKLISPDLQQQILVAARHFGVPDSVDFDEYCDVVERQG